MKHRLEDRWTVRGNCGAPWRDYICVLHAGHPGPHQASNRGVTGVWPDKEEGR